MKRTAAIRRLYNRCCIWARRDYDVILYQHTHETTHQFGVNPASTPIRLKGSVMFANRNKQNKLLVLHVYACGRSCDAARQAINRHLCAILEAAAAPGKRYSYISGHGLWRMTGQGRCAEQIACSRLDVWSKLALRATDSRSSYFYR